MRYDAVQTFSTLIGEHQQADGSFSAMPGTPNPQSADVDTMFFVSNLGMALWALRPQLSPAEVASWTTAIARGADYLVANGNLSFYTNGNIAIGNSLVMATAYWASGDPKYQSDYNAALSFAIAPPQSRWPGAGLVYTTVPTLSSGVDGAAYFAESGGGAPGFDADYTQLQLDQLARLYILTSSPTVLRLIELLFNQESPRVNQSTWSLDTSGGTRHPQGGRSVPFTTPALAILGLYGGRGDLAGLIHIHTVSIERSFASYTTYWSPGAQYGFGAEAASLVLIGI
jgi:hypothetical protein